MSGPTSGMSLWYRADRGVLNSSGTSCTNGQSIVRWKDQSGNGNDATSGTSPIFAASSINGLPSVNFNNSLLSTGSSITPTYAFFVANIPSAQAVTNWDVLLGLQNVGDSGYIARLQGNTYNQWGSDSNNLMGVSRSNGSVLAVTNTDDTPVANDIFAQYTSVPNPYVTYSGTTTQTLGIGQTDSRPITAYVGEIIIYSGTLTNSQITQNEKYLINKWVNPKLFSSHYGSSSVGNTARQTAFPF